MIRTHFKKIAACLLLAGATAGLWYGADSLRLSPEELAAIEAVEAEAAAQAAETAATEETEPLPEPEEKPAPDDLEGRLKAGDFRVLADDTPVAFGELEEVYRSLKARSRYVKKDVNGDGRQELLWLAGSEDLKAEAVVAVFAREKDTERLVLWDPEPDDDYYAEGSDGLVYIRKNEWIITEFHCTNVLFDRAYDLYAGDSLFLYIIEDEDAYFDEVDAALRRRMEDVDGRGVWYYALETGGDMEQARRIDAAEWFEQFHAMTGSTLLYVSPSVEEIRSGVASGVARSSYVVRRADGSYEEAVYYPKMTGDNRQSVNNVLKDTAFEALLSGYTDIGTDETTEEYLSRMRSDPSVLRTAETSFRLVSDTDTLLSVMYRTRRGTDGGFDKTELRFLTIDKQTGRQLQIGDMANAETIARAVAEGSAELFYASGDDVVFVRDEDPAHDVEWMSEVVAGSREAGDVWKKAGLDEQYLFMIVTTDRETGSEAVLRIPRWKVGMSTPGHMELLTWHEAYPFLRATLDMASSLTVRKNPGGFLIGYHTDTGGRQSLYLRGTKQELPAPDASPEECRDFFAQRYEDMTGFFAGTYDDPEAEGGSGDFYGVEVNRGAGGYTFLRTNENRYVIERQRDGAQGVSVSRMAIPAGTGLTVAGSLYTDGTGAGTWRNYETGQLTLRRRVTLEDLFTFTLTPVPGTGNGYGLLETAPESNAGAVERFTLSGSGQVYTFRDINLDGFTDFTVGVIDEEDHGGEQNFFYHPGLNRYTDGPEELEQDIPYSFDASTGYALVGNPEEEAVLYTFDTEGAFRKLRKLTRKASGEDGAASLLMTAEKEPVWGAEEDDAEGEILLRDTLSGEDLEDAELLFRSEFVFRGTLLPGDPEAEARTDGEAQSGEAQAGEEAPAEPGLLQVIVTKRHFADIIRPLDTVRIYLLAQDGTFIGSMEPENASGSRLVSVEAEGIRYDGTLTPEGALVIRHEDDPVTDGTDAETEETAAAADERIVRVTVEELLRETGYGRD